MGRFPKLSLVGVMALMLPLVAQQQGAEEEILDEPTFSLDVKVVNLLATVKDGKGLLVNSLTKDEFILEEDGVRQDVTYFARQTDLPITIGLLVDTSVSQQRLIEDERYASSKFFEAILREKKDLAFLMSFDTNIELLQDYTDSRTLLVRGLEDLQIESSSGGLRPGPTGSSGRVGTALYDSIYLACDEMFKGQIGRKALVLISDGNDSGSKMKIEQAIEAAHRSDVVIFSIRYFDRQFYMQYGQGFGGSGTLNRISRDTGGSLFEVTKRKTLSSIYEAINDEMRNQYSIGYSPKRDLSVLGFRKIKLRTRQKGRKVQARQGYYPGAI
jgi:VWFA-related protein